MANTQALRRRIKTAQNVSKTTRAMQMIAASKLKKAQEAALSSRPYVHKLVEVTQNLAPKKDSEEAPHPYMEDGKEVKKTLYIVVSPDKGLCGGLVTNLIREYLKYKSDSSFFITVGKKVEGAVASTSKNLLASFPFGNTLPPFESIMPLISLINDNFLGKKVDNVKIITTHFNNIFSQETRVTDVLPIQFEEDNKEKKTVETLFEPSQKELLPALLKRYLEMVIYQHLLESYASEQAARMLAMQNATNNAKDIVSDLRLLYNKARQERITKEILDISSAAVAMEER